MPLRKARPPRGQHFLTDQVILERIASSLPLEPGSRVVEIGAGPGALTEHLLAGGASVTAIEVDSGLARSLRRRFAGSAALDIHEADILELDLADLVRRWAGEPVLLAGNLPYYITSPILRRIFVAREWFAQAVLLMQKEVALRVTAEKGSRDYGLLSVLTRLHTAPAYLFSVPRRAFQPPPQVTSAAVRLVPHAKPVDDALVVFLQRCFQQPRKMLLNNLAGAYARSKLAALPESRRRAQELTLEELTALWRRLS